MCCWQMHAQIPVVEAAGCTTSFMCGRSFLISCTKYTQRVMWRVCLGAVSGGVAILGDFDKGAADRAFRRIGNHAHPWAKEDI